MLTVVVDYGMGNLRSVAKALEHVGKSDDARLLRGPVPAMSHWDADDLEFLRISARCSWGRSQTKVVPRRRSCLASSASMRVI